MESLIFWQNASSIHQAPLIRELACQWKGEVLCICENDVAEERLRQGWTRPDFSPAKAVVAPSRTQRQALVAKHNGRDSVHIFSGFHAYPETYRTMKLVSRTPAIMGVYSEPGRSDDGLKVMLRGLRYRVCGAQWGRRLDFLVATGRTGVQWYRRAKFPPDRIFPFGYFVEMLDYKELDETGPATTEEPGQPFRIIFVGQLVPRKGVDLLLRALPLLRNRSWRLDVVGQGPLMNQYRELAHSLGIGERVRWLGGRSNVEARRLISQADALVLPSRYDGWGAVINEALVAGTPVVASGACGAADLVRSPDLGFIFSSGSVEQLKKALDKGMGGGVPSESRRARIRDWADAAIAPSVGASYLLEIIGYVNGKCGRPAAPWDSIAFA